MSTAEGREGLRAHVLRHPDRAWVEQVRSDLAAWLELPPPLSGTRSLTGGGAIAALEQEVSAGLDGRPAVLTASATFGLRLALAAVGAAPGTEVLVPALDWPSTWSAVVSLGARPVPVAVDPATLTIAPAAAAAARTPRTVAVVACHAHGVCADVPVLRATTGLPVVEDAAGALGSTLDGRPAGLLGDFAVFSLGPGKSVDAGEGGIVVAATEAGWERVVRLSSHPLRAARAGVEAPDHDAFVVRPHPVAAVLGLLGWRRHAAGLDAARAQYARTVAALTAAGLGVLGDDGRRAAAQDRVPVLFDDPATPGERSGAVRLGPPDADQDTLLRRVRLVPVEPYAAPVREDVSR